jgi:predicted XRE-type DNA-binding protein
MPKLTKTKQQALAAAGWRVGSAQAFLGLTDEETVLVELKLRLSDALRQRRTQLKLSQTAVATRLHSSQSRVAKMEAADASVTLDLLVRSLLALGATPKDLARAIQAA